MEPVPHLRLVKTPPSEVPPDVPIDLRGDDAVAAMFLRYGRYVARIAHRLLGLPSEVDDVVQDVFVEAVQRIEQVRDPEAIRGWLAAITVRLVSRRLKRKKWRRFLGLDAAPGYELLEAPGASPEQRALLASVYDVLARVPVDCRAAWVLRHVEGEQLDAVALACRCSLATVKRRIAVAQSRIDEALGHDHS